MASPRSLRVALVSPAEDVYSETFIHAHRRLLAGEVLHYHGGALPSHLRDEGPLLGRGVLERGVRSLSHRLRRLAGAAPTLREDAVCRSFREQSVDVVLAEFGPTGSALVPVCKRLSLPLVVHFHGYDAARRDVLARQREGYRALFDYASTVVVVSRPMQAALRELGARDSTLLYNPYGPDPAFFDVDASLEAPLLLSVGRFVPKKAPHYVIRAFREVLGEFPDAELLMAGEGPLLNRCRVLVERLDLGGHVRFRGVIEHAEFRDLLRRGRAFVQHSITAEDGDREGSPVAIMEAGAAGVPVVSTRHAGIPEVVEEGRTGFLVEEHDVEGMARHMARLLASRDLARRIGQAARVRIREHFPLRAHIDRLDQALSKAVFR